MLPTPPSKTNGCDAPLLANFTGFTTCPILLPVTGISDSNRIILLEEIFIVTCRVMARARVKLMIEKKTGCETYKNNIDVTRMISNYLSVLMRR